MTFPHWFRRLILLLPAPVLGGALIVLHLAALPAMQETLGQVIVVLGGCAALAVWARAELLPPEG